MKHLSATAATVPSQEIERKYLLRELPGFVEKVPPITIAQGYLVIEGDEREVRLRRIDNACLLTVKLGYGVVRTEEEIFISEKEFRQLWPLTESRRINKTRRRIEHDGHLIEVDVFENLHAGLLMAEVEFSSVAESEAFQPPAWFEREVTHEPAYRNRALALHPPLK